MLYIAYNSFVICYVVLSIHVIVIHYDVVLVIDMCISLWIISN